MFGKWNKKGFTFIELVIAITIIAMMAITVVPRFTGRSASAEREKFFTKLNAILQLTYQNALATGKIHSIAFYFDKQIIQAEIEQKEKTVKGELKFDPLNLSYLKTNVSFENYDLRNFFIKKDDKLAGGGITKKVWFYITPGGLAQEVIINFYDKKLLDDPTANAQYSFVLNPFTVQFKMYDSFQRPS
ncbi:type II secretion system GspH family protein [Candidatus Dependentiae bacterium]|nr:type II secretion system GspH family protein [Candidatus Dependentiae bacterium]